MSCRFNFRMDPPPSFRLQSFGRVLDVAGRLALRILGGAVDDRTTSDKPRRSRSIATSGPHEHLEQVEIVIKCHESQHHIKTCDRIKEYTGRSSPKLCPA